MIESKRWYAAPGSLPILVEVSYNDWGAWVGIYCVDQKRLFETEREALEFALKQKQEAREKVEKEYAAILDRIDEMEVQEVASEFLV